jgi:hypothetical protein
MCEGNDEDYKKHLVGKQMLEMWRTKISSDYDQRWHSVAVVLMQVKGKGKFVSVHVMKAYGGREV